MGHLLMSDEERQHKVFFEMVKQGQLTLKEVSNQIDLGYRQIKRKYTRWKKKGDVGLKGTPEQLPLLNKSYRKQKLPLASDF